MMTKREFDSVIPVKPVPPYPIVSDYCNIVCGFGRGSAELGIPTANVPVEELPAQINKLELGIYFGFAKVKPVDKQEAKFPRKDGTEVNFNYGKYLEKENGDMDSQPVVLSIGKNPFYGNDFSTLELHILHQFQSDFYGAQVKFCILGHLRPELDYTTKDALIKDINIDISKALDVLSKENYSTLSSLLN